MTKTSFLNDLTASLRQSAATRREKPIHHVKNVSFIVRSILPIIEEIKPELTWDEIAQIMEKKGIRWKNGKALTGKDLRCVVSRIKKTSSISSSSSLQNPNILPQSQLLDSKKESKETHGYIQVKEILPSSENQKSLSSVISDNIPNSQSDKSRRQAILNEMKRASEERKK